MRLNTLARTLLVLSAATLMGCPSEDSTGDSTGDPDPVVQDADSDGVADADDNCSDVPNADQADLDTDGEGDGCDPDADGDSILADADCDDLSAAVGTETAWYADTDGDGLGDADDSLAACDAPDGYVGNSSDAEPDCETNDTDACGECGGDGGAEWYADIDEDGLGDPANSVATCEVPEGYVDNADDQEPDCATNDTDTCGVCAGPGLLSWYADDDSDGLGDPAATAAGCVAPEGYVANADDLEPTCTTNDTDSCGICAGPGELSWYADDDSDDLGDPDVSQVACTAPEEFVSNADDLQPNCTTNDVDECGVCGGPGASTYYADTDDDGLGDPAAMLMECGDAPDGYVINADDEQPNCTTNDEDVCGVCAGPGEYTFYSDGDGDGLGDGFAPVQACSVPAGFVSNADDEQPNCTTDDEDDCGVCAGDNSAIDCVGVCFGEAFVDDCSACVGGTTGREASVTDTDGDLIPDSCDLCNGGDARTIVQWQEIPALNSEGGPFTFQAVLYENGDFSFTYEEMEPFEGVTATVGLQSPGGANYVRLGLNDEYARGTDQAFFIHDDVTGIPELEYTVPYTWYDIQGIGTPLTLGDDGFEQVNVAHGFTFFGEEYQEVFVGSNGVLGFGDTRPGHQNTDLPNSGLGAFIAPFWEDLSPQRGGQVLFYTAPSGCDIDCDGMAGGVAVEDACGVCIGGTTGMVSAAAIDCSGECFGEAFLDACGICAGGSTGLDPLDGDCIQAPDLVIDESYMALRMYVDYVDGGTEDEPSCYINENCLAGPGMRKVIRFGTRIGNVGNAPLTLGVPPANGTNEGPWIWDSCHGHHHYEAYARYDVIDPATGENVTDGAKAGFCVMDLGTYRPDLVQDNCNTYNCGNQGIGAGCQDTYWSGLSCQWVDVTGLPDGDYQLSVTTNPLGEIEELDYNNNTGSVLLRMTDDSLEMLDSDEL
jgi:hypothetical protein